MYLQKMQKMQKKKLKRIKKNSGNGTGKNLAFCQEIPAVNPKNYDFISNTKYDFLIFQLAVKSRAVDVAQGVYASYEAILRN